MSSKTISVNGIEISIFASNQNDYICLTDMVKNMDNSHVHIGNWLRKKDTVEYLGIWERLNNPSFKLIEFDEFKRNAGLNRFTLSPKQWVESTDAVGLISKSGKYGGTYAHKDIAFHFAMWLSPEFQLLIVREFQRLKEEESKTKNLDWDVRRYISKVNYRLQTDAVKSVLVPISNLPKEKEGLLYANEADMVYVAMFGFTSKEWRLQNQDLVLKGLNIRDVANTHQLIVLSNLESLDSVLIKSGVTDSKRRLEILRHEAISQMKTLESSNDSEHVLMQSPNLLEPKKEPLSELNKNLKAALNYNPKDK